MNNLMTVIGLILCGFQLVSFIVGFFALMFGIAAMSLVLSAIGVGLLVLGIIITKILDII